MRLYSSLLLVLAASLACALPAGDKPSGDDSGAGDPDPDTDADADADADTDTDTDTDADPAPDCPEYSGLTHVGARRVWEYDYGSTRVTTSWEIVTWDLPELTVRTESTQTVGDTTYLTTSLYAYRCVAGDGLYLDGAGSTSEYGGTTYESTTTYDPPARTMPFGIVEGTTWTTTYTGTSTADDASTTFSSTVDVVAASEETVEVQAGTYLARRFDSTTVTGGGTFEGSWWADAELGMVKDSYGELVQAE